MKLLLYVLLITAMIFISFKQEQNNKKIFKQIKCITRHMENGNIEGHIVRKLD